MRGLVLLGIGVFLASFAGLTGLAVLSVRIERQLALLHRAHVNRLIGVPCIAFGKETRRY